MVQIAVCEAAAPTVEQAPAPLTIRFEPVIERTTELFEQFCALNDDMRVERDCKGVIEIMLSVDFEAGSKELDIGADMKYWAKA